MLSLTEFISALRQKRDIVTVEEPVDPKLELAEIHRRVIAADGPALFFTNVKGSSFPVVTNLFGTRERVDLAFQNRPDIFLKTLIDLATRDFPPKLGTLFQKRHQLKKILSIGTKRRKTAPVLECQMETPDLERLPLLTTWPEDGGPFITLPLVYTEPIHHGPPNLGMYRIQRYNKTETGLHWQIGKGGGFHHYEAEQADQDLPVTIFLGGPPALIMSAILPLPENVPELMFASILQGKKLDVAHHTDSLHPLIGECEFALHGKALAHQRRLEGPFGDHYGYYSLAHDFPVFKCSTVFHKKDAIYPATVVGKPCQEDAYIGEYLQHLLSPLFPVVMPGVQSLWSYMETGFHSLGAAVVKERYHRECMASAFRILGEGQLALTKFLLLTDQPVDLCDFRTVLTTILERFQPEKDLFIFANLSLDTLDYTGPELNKGSRGVLLGMGDPVRKLPTEYIGPTPHGVRKLKAFCPGCLCVEGEIDIKPLLNEIKDWPLIIWVDSVEKACASTANFLWTVFTRFEPAADIHAANETVFRHHLCYQLPIFIDARMKPSYPKEVFCDPQTAETVTQRWNHYFPDGMEMGDSDVGHLAPVEQLQLR